MFNEVGSNCTAAGGFPVGRVPVAGVAFAVKACLPCFMNSGGAKQVNTSHSVNFSGFDLFCFEQQLGCRWVGASLLRMLEGIETAKAIQALKTEKENLCGFVEKL